MGKNFKIAIALAAFVGITLSVWSSLLLRGWEDNGIVLGFQNEVDGFASALEQELALNFGVLYSIRDFYNASTEVTRDDFRVFTSQGMGRYRSLKSLEWVLRVPRSERAHFETLAGEHGFPGFQIQELDPNGNWVPAGERDEYFPIWYEETLRNPSPEFGYDLATHPVLANVLSECGRTGKMGGAGPLRIGRGQDESRLFLAVMPVYLGPADTEEDRRKNLFGFAIGEYQLDKIFENTFYLFQKNPVGIDTTFYENTEKNTLTEIHHHRSRTGQDAEKFIEYQIKVDNIVGKNWVLRAYPTQKFIQSRRTFQPLTAFSGGMVVVCLMITYLWVVGNRATEVEQLVQTRSRELLESESRLKAIMENMADGIVTVDENGKIESANSSALQMFGFTIGEIPGKNITLLIPERFQSPQPDSPEGYPRTEIAKWVGTGLFETVGRRKDGTEFPLEIGIGEVQKEGRRLFVGTLRDITDRKKMERQRETLLNQLQQVNSELSQYAFVVSHDLKAPLRAVSNYIHFLAEDLGEHLREKMKIHLDGIRSAMAQGEQLVDDLLAITRVGSRSQQWEKIDMGEFMRELVSSLRLPEDVRTALAEIWPEIEADRTLLRQIFQNLIENAVKFNPSAIKTVELGWRPNGAHHVELFVRDDGTGIDPRDQENIFHMFHRLHSREDFPGTGIGLAIVRKASSAMNGSAWVESTPGEGSTFFVELPKTQKEIWYD